MHIRIYTYIMLNRFTYLKKNRIVNNNHLFRQKKLFSNKDEIKNKDKIKNTNVIHFIGAAIGGTIGFIKGDELAKKICGPQHSDKAAYIISMGFMGAAVGYVGFIMFPIIVPVGLATVVLIENLDKNKPKKDK